MVPELTKEQYSRVEIIVDEVELMNARREAQAPEAMPPQAVELLD